MQFNELDTPPSGNECDIVVQATRESINFEQRRANHGGYDRRGITCDLVQFAPKKILEKVIQATCWRQNRPWEFGSNRVLCLGK